MKLYQGKYFQGSLSDKQVEKLIGLRDLDEVENLRYCICQLRDDVLEKLIDDGDLYNKENLGMHGFEFDFEVYRPDMSTVSDEKQQMIEFGKNISGDYFHPLNEIFFENNKTSDNNTGMGLLSKLQTIGVAFCYYSRSCILGDAVGLGKTIQMAGLVNILNKVAKKQRRSLRYCFLTESPSVGQIRRKMVQFTGEYCALLQNGEKSVIDKFITNNMNGLTCSIVGSHSVIDSAPFLTYCSKYPFDLIILDESSFVKNTTSGKYQNAKALLSRHSRKIMLNATPLELNLMEFYNQLNILDDDYMPTISDFKKNYCVLDNYRNVVGYKNENIFTERIKLRYIARTRKDEREKSEEGNTTYAYEDNQCKTIVCELSSIQKERMKKTSLYQMLGDYPAGVFRDLKFNTDTTPKLRALLYIINKWNKDKRTEYDLSVTAVEGFKPVQILIYCHFVECQSQIKTYLEEQGYNVAILNGNTKIKERTRIIDEFNSGRHSIIITNVQKGIDLKNCNHLILYSIDYNPQKMVQIEGRITRESKIIGKRIVMLVSSGKEKKYLEEELKMRITASINFTVTDASMVIDTILSEEWSVFREGESGS